MNTPTDSRALPEQAQEALKNCPFCNGGSVDTWRNGLDGRTIRCRDCNYRWVYSSMATDEEAIAAWNRRVAPPAAGGELLQAERLRENGFLCRAWGETDLPEAACELTLENVERFIVEAQFGEYKLIDELTDLHEENVTMLREQMKDMQDALDDKQGIWQISFEIGGISIEPVTFVPAALSAAPVPKGAAQAQDITTNPKGN